MKFGIVGFAALVVLAVVAYPVALLSSQETIVCTVDEKDRTKNSDGGSDARVYTQDCGVLQVSDSLLMLHFSSADVYSTIDEGETYEFTTMGWRVPLLSMFPNVIEVNKK